MGTGPKVALLAAAVVTAVVLLIVLRPGGDDDSSAEQVAQAKITVTNDEVSGPERIELQQGQQVVFTVESDVEDEVHVHGYDLLSSVAPGRPARFLLRAETPGRFEVELHEQELPLTELVVTP